MNAKGIREFWRLLCEFFRLGRFVHSLVPVSQFLYVDEAGKNTGEQEAMNALTNAIKNLRRSYALFSVFALALLGFAASADYAQSSNGTIVGSVKDPSGAAVPKAKVIGTSTALGVERDTETDATGAYRLENLPPGTYSVKVEAGGFSAYSVTGIVVKAALESTANASLEVGSISNTVTVEASTAQELQSESGSLGAEISNAEITSLPINSLNPVELVM